MVDDNESQNITECCANCGKEFPISEMTVLTLGHGVSLCSDCYSKEE